jgi:hypothetical protein
VTYDDWKLRSDRDEYPEPDERVLCYRDGVERWHADDEFCEICYEPDEPAEPPQADREGK